VFNPLLGTQLSDWDEELFEDNTRSNQLERASEAVRKAILQTIERSSPFVRANIIDLNQGYLPTTTSVFITLDKSENVTVIPPQTTLNE
jgi:hypothetical protein